MKIIGMIGSRRRDSILDRTKLKEAFLRVYTDGDRLVSGGCPSGGDHFAEVLAKHLSIPITIHYAKWDKLGKAAGFIRNTDIAKDADYLIAAAALNRTGGTEDTITKWLKMRDLTEEVAVSSGQLILV